jgi:hypothetical protein
MSRTQNTFVDYTNLGDTGTDTAGSIQPLETEPASAANLNRSPQNLRSRTEIQRDIVEDLLYYRDTAPRYLIDLSGGGLLSWEVGGAGRVNNTTALSLRPFVGPRTDVKGTLYVGTAASNQLRYTVAATAYAADGMNAITVEHRSVTGTVTPVVTISAGPVYHILVLFDSANTGHSAGVVQPLVSSAIAGVGALASKLVVSTSAVPAVAILATSGRVPLNVRTHTGGLSGAASADLEEHTLAAGALDTFTTTNPLQEGDLLAVRYDYVAEDAGTGGRAQSSVARGSADVAANLFIAQAHPEWLPGCVPLCKVLHGRLVWVDGTILATGTSMTPGGTYATYVDVTAFTGLPTQVVNGGIDNTIDPTVSAALISVDQRLSQSRYATWTATDGTNSTGGHYNGVGAVAAAVAAATNGGDIVVRRGVYTSALPSITVTSGGLALRGETHDGTLTSRTRMTAASSTTVNADVTLENLAYLRSGAFATTLTRSVDLRNVTLQAGALALAGAAGNYTARLDNVTMLNTVSTGDHTVAGLSLDTLRTHVTNSHFIGPDPLSTGTKPCVRQGALTALATYENCTFTSTKSGCLPFAFEGAVNETTFVNCTFRLEGSPGSYVVDFDGLSLGGTVKFIGCRFTNAEGFAVIRARPVTGTVIFDNCTLHANGSPDGIAVGAQCVAIFAPLTAAKVIVKSCTATVTETNFTGILRSLVRLGGSETGACAGALKVDGFDLVLAGVGTALPATACVLLQGNAKCAYARVTVDHAGKRAPTTTVYVPEGAGCYSFAGYGSEKHLLRLRDFRVYNADAPLVTDSATCVSGWLRLQGCDLDGFDMTTVTAPSTNTFRSNSLDIRGSSVRNASVHLFKYHNTVGAINLIGLYDSPAVFENSFLYAAASLTGGITLGYCLFTQDGGTVRNVTFRDETVSACTWLFSLLDTSNVHNTVDGNDFRINCDTMFLTSSFSTTSNGVRITNNDVALQRTIDGSGFLDLNGTLDGARITSNRFTTDGATAAGCTPNPTTVVATAVTAVSNNTFRTSGVYPS